jgi:hypothetical protein
VRADRDGDERRQRQRCSADERDIARRGVGGWRGRRRRDLPDGRGVWTGRLGHIPGERRDRVHAPCADQIRRRTRRDARGRADAMHYLSRRQFGKPAAHQRHNAGHVRGGVAGAADREQLMLIIG